MSGRGESSGPISGQRPRGRTIVSNAWSSLPQSPQKHGHFLGPENSPLWLLGHPEHRQGSDWRASGMPASTSSGIWTPARTTIWSVAAACPTASPGADSTQRNDRSHSPSSRFTVFGEQQLVGRVGTRPAARPTGLAI